MKYIRTKDGIIVDTTKYNKIVERTFNDKVVAIDLNHWGQDNDKHPTWIDAEDIVNQADTIEELCDEFVYHFLKNDNYQIMPKTDLEPQRRDCLSYHIEKKLHDVLGAIWTDKGLIYVAKMNEEGELELL